MFIVFLIFLLIASIMVLIVKRNKETFYLFAMCISLALMLTGILVYIAKKGGISREVQNFFYFNLEIKTSIQYFLITLDHLGYLVAIGRYLFPLFLLLLAIHYSMIVWIRRNYWLKRVIFIPPIISLLLYYPDIFRTITKNNLLFQSSIVYFSFTWIVIYIAVSIFLFLYEAYSINMQFFRRQFILIITFIFSLTLLYLLYFEQDPAQVYQFYSSGFIWRNGIYYLKSVLSVPTYTFIVLLNIICAIVGFASLLRYTKDLFESSKEGEIIQRQSKAVTMGASVFVHGIKNQLLTNRVIYKRMERIFANESLDKEQLKHFTDQLAAQNENILLRIESLYNAVKTNQVHLVPVQLKTVIDEALSYYHHKYSNSSIHLQIQLSSSPTLLADKEHLSEAIYNLLVNAYDAIADSTSEKGTIMLHVYSVRLYHVIEVTDSGVGMTKEEMRQICEPFYSNKNSNYNWGMGLYYIRSIANEHFGSLKFESKKGEGSTFYLLLPKFK
ncbi:sensor histidine kinase [Pseudogracilibacillus auburnensis]|uniref:sensor histidine kinase n=1 Tax=Pseudogracilibacillus auburnensis TaxID=1494959 RepID=UPI001A975FE6|nr:HAMP domain-containing sensor histidine kinase [Pseudogracilibacillus auburnensis]MBO1004376.1 HAMP domain-containing histidine kinase [Pseudogracilibacillus auburnensis]